MAGWLVMIAGLGVALTSDTTAGLWLTLMGWFLGRASRLARAQDQLIRLTAGLDVGDALQQDVAVVSSGLTLDTLLAQNQLTGGPDVYTVKQGDVLLGVIDIRDVRAIPATAPDGAAGGGPDAAPREPPVGARGPGPVGCRGDPGAGSARRRCWWSIRSTPDTCWGW